jgi:hypothetical protein
MMPNLRRHRQHFAISVQQKNLAGWADKMEGPLDRSAPLFHSVHGQMSHLAVSAKVITNGRKLLRHAILAMCPDITSSEIYTALCSPDHAFLRLADLIPFCRSANVDPQLLRDMLLTYGIYADSIPRDKFIRFIDDEFTCKSLIIRLPPLLTDTQAAILSKLCKAIRSRRIQSSPASLDPISEVTTTSQLWIYVTRMSPKNSKVTSVQIASLCRLARDLNLTFSPEDLIEALFAFFGQKCESLNFAQFTRLMQRF